MRQADWPRAGVQGEGDGGDGRPDEPWRDDRPGQADLAGRLARLTPGHPSAPRLDGQLAADPAGAGQEDDGDLGNGPADPDFEPRERAGRTGDGAFARRGSAGPAPAWSPVPAADRGAYRPWFSGEGTADPWFAGPEA
jgi:hypothetical protein